MAFSPSNNKMDSSVIDKLKENSRRSLHCKVKRKMTVPVACIKCNRFQVQSQVSVGFCCSFCGKYQDTKESNEKYERGEVEYSEDNRSAIGCPAIKTSDGRDYAMLRDESEIKADWFINGKTRDNMGIQNFDRSLKKELKKNKCYRGHASDVG